MKRNLLIILTMSAVLFSCDNGKQDQIDQLQAENSDFKTRIEMKDSVLLQFMKSIAAIEDNLTRINEREMNISVERIEGDSQNIAHYTEIILSDIRSIDNLILENKKKIAGLNSLLRLSNNENDELHGAMNDMRVQLQRKIEEQEDAIATLKMELKARSQDIEGLMADIQTLEYEQEQLIQEMNTGYYVISDFRDLEEKKIVGKEGGLLGVFGRSVALEDNFTDSFFSPVDTRELLSLQIKAKKVELVTTHNTDSYQIKSASGDGNKLLVISDPEKFWEKSQYLVVLTKN